MLKMSISNLSISFVIPCLNEERTLPLVLRDIFSLRSQFKNVEVIVADNGSKDRSRQIALQFGARVVEVIERGYGTAIKAGINAARYEYICFADADHTYDFTETVKLAAHLEKNNYSLVLGDRFSGRIEKGAMPFLHRYFGTPVLSSAISILIGGKWGLIKDCNSGFRLFRKADFISLSTKCSGMEFASEMLIKYLKSSHKIGWVPITLRKDRMGRTSHVQTWRDGMRHLVTILTEIPLPLKYSGIFFLFLGMVVWLSLVSAPLLTFNLE